MTTLLRIDEPPRVPPSGWALFALGFRPFYLLASLFAALSIPLWMLQVSGLVQHAYLAGPIWHAHEMLFGFTLAVIVGFLLTAGQNWTNQPTPSGWRLAALVALWVAARVLVLTPFVLAAAVTNVAFPVAAAVALAVPFWRSRNRRNYFFVGLLLLMAVAVAVVHLGQSGVLAVSATAAVQVGLDVVLFILVVMGGRVIPMFTNNGVPGTGATRHPLVEKAALGGILLLLAVDALVAIGLTALAGAPLAVIAALAAAAQAWRFWLWRPWRTRRVPLVWILHLAYLWVPIHLLLRSLAEVGWVLPSLATHALTVGAVGGLVIGMMTRTARGHTGLPLKADRFDVTCYVLVAAAAAVRVLLPLAAPGQLILAGLMSALLWSAGFGLYAFHYAPLLCRPRRDGRPG